MFCVGTEKKTFSDEFKNLVKHGKNEEVKFIVKDDAVPSDLVDGSGITLLHLAATYNNVDLIQFLLDMGCDVNAKNSRGNTPLLLAALYNQIEASQVLLDNDADIFLANAAGKTALQMITERERAMSLDVIKSCFRNLKKAAYDVKTTAAILTKANCRHDYLVMYLNNAEITGLVLDNFLDFSCNDLAFIHSAVEHAIKSMDLKHIEILATRGALSRDGMKIFLQMMYSRIGFADNSQNLQNAVELYMKQLPRPGTNDMKLLKFLQKVFEEGNANIIEMFLKYDIDDYVRNEYGQELIAHLFYNNRVNVMSVLRDRPFDVNGRGERDCTALHFAVIISSDNIEILLKLGANPNIANEIGFTALHLAVQKSDEKIVKVLLTSGANPNIVDYLRCTALHLAVDESNANIIKILLESGADPNLKNYDENTALRIAVRKSKEIFAEILLESGACPNITDIHGRTPLFYTDSLRIVRRLLLRYGADSQIIANDGGTIFDINKKSTGYVLAHLAFLTEEGTSLKREIQIKIQSSEKMKVLYEKFCRQVKDMKAYALSSRLTLFSLLVKKPEDIAPYTTSQKVVDTVRKIMENLKIPYYELYGTIALEQLKIALHIYNLRCKAAKLITKCICRLGACPVVKEEIIRYLTYEDLLRLFKETRVIK